MPIQGTTQCVRMLAASCLLMAMTGCSVFESSYVIEPELGPMPGAIASASESFAAEPFSLVAADSIGLATFGFEIAQWAENPPHEALARQN